ncbi:MAG TPA: SDR family NAD(P)-dependent oxidoreductase [Kofleriaceae bacterium]|jgi:short-subunit dehydrogenase
MATQNKNKLAVITGGSSGIGLALAKQCLENGFDALICAENDEVMQIAKTLPGNVEALKADLSTFDGCEQLVARVHDGGRPVDALLLNAGVGLGHAVIDQPLEDELAMIALNCNHTVHVARRLVPAMVQRGAGRVLITGSVVSTSPNPYQAVYAATKAFVMSFGEALRVEVADSGVTVTVLQPGATDTRFFQRGELMDTKVGQAKKDDPALVAKRGFDAMMAGKDSVLGGGFKSRLEGLMNELLPESFKAKQTAKQTKPQS